MLDATYVLLWFFAKCFVAVEKHTLAESEWQNGTDQTAKWLASEWNRVHLEKLTGSQLVKKFFTFMEPKGSLPHSQVPSFCPDLQLSPILRQLGAYSHIPLPEDPP